MNIGDRYNWKNQPERLVYTGKSGPWFKFAKVERPGVNWCQVLQDDLHMLEETKSEATAP